VETVWTFLYRGEDHKVVCFFSKEARCCTIHADFKEVLNTFVSKVDCKFGLGRTLASAFQCRVVSKKDGDLELFIDGQRFEDAHREFVAHINSVQAEMRLDRGDRVSVSKSVHERTRSAVADVQYINENWNRSDEVEKTKRGYSKSRVSWKFTIKGTAHELVLEHGHVGGKRKISLDGEVLIEIKLGLMQSNKSGRYIVAVDGIPLEVRIKKLSDAVSEAADPAPRASLVERVVKKRFAYALFIDAVPFDLCCKSSFDFLEGKAVNRTSVHCAMTETEMDNVQSFSWT